MRSNIALIERWIVYLSYTPETGYTCHSRRGLVKNWDKWVKSMGQEIP
jgi:hypothetical protein